ncbi:hypothetical protein Xkoz_01894 [Xenorhabdus kozodoii]|uniref:Uncharacterized protein n=1 Tax=Xenorhabdus kozodoii TaxID=351676 RepID=A0A2D0LCQ3_9GAMM|nr:hypothetical protein Xkoz_01894 [Xenorhabdus kozodoii]
MRINLTSGLFYSGPSFYGLMTSLTVTAFSVSVSLKHPNPHKSVKYRLIISRPISIEAVAAGEGALQTCSERRPFTK